MMTFEQAKDQVAVKHGFDNWIQLHLQLLSFQPETAKWKYDQEAAQLYAKSKWDEACEAQQLVYFNHVNNEAKPEFKP